MAKKIIFLDKKLENMLGDKFILKHRYKMGKDGRPELGDDGRPVVEETIYGTPRNILIDIVAGYNKPKDNEETLKIFEIAMAIKNAEATISDFRDSDIKVIERIIEESGLSVELRGQILKNHITEVKEEEVSEVVKAEESTK